MPPRRRHRVGQPTVTVAAGPQSLPISKHIQALLGSLYMDMAAIKKSIEAFDKRSSSEVPVELQELLAPCCKSIFHFADSYKVQRGRVGRKARQSVEGLYKALMQFDEDYSKLKKVVHIPRALNLIICDLITAVNHFVRQYWMTMSSIKVTNPIPLSGKRSDWDRFIQAETKILRGQEHVKVLSHRPKDWVLRECFEELTSKHQSIHGDHTFMKFDAFKISLQSLGQQKGVNLQCSERTYRNLKNSWKSGAFNNIV